VLFFLSMGLINLYVAYTFSTDFWVDFKLFGMLGLTLAFVVGQSIYLARYFKPEAELADGDAAGADSKE
jgi:intracellular septation protein